jgi:hypothetical protein
VGVSVVVGCDACGETRTLSIAEHERRKCKCGRARRILLSDEQNAERWRRGISLDAWFLALRAPPRRAQCEDGDRPCPFLRCTHNLGVPGGFGCELDVTDEGIPEDSEDGTIAWPRIVTALGEHDESTVRKFADATIERLRAEHPNATRRELAEWMASLRAANDNDDEDAA